MPPIDDPRRPSLDPTAAGGRRRSSWGSLRMRLTIGALVLLLVLAAALGDHHPVRGAAYRGVETDAAPAVSFRVSSSGDAVTDLRFSGPLPGTCQGLTVPADETTAIHHASTFSLVLPLRSDGAPAGRLALTGVFGRDGHENGELEVLPGGGLSARCEATAAYSTETTSSSG